AGALATAAASRLPCPPRERQPRRTVDVLIPLLRREVVGADGVDQRRRVRLPVLALELHGQLVSVRRPRSVRERLALLADFDGLECRLPLGLEPEGGDARAAVRRRRSRGPHPTDLAGREGLRRQRTAAQDDEGEEQANERSHVSATARGR